MLFFSIVLLILFVALITVNNTVGIGLIIYAGFIYLILSACLVSKWKLDKIIIIFFAFCIPFITDLNIFFDVSDFHVVSKPYFTFNIVQPLLIFFIFRIIAEKSKIKIGRDIILLISFNIICIISIFNAINFEAAFFDYIRYFNFTIIYIYFSRVFNNDEYEGILVKCIVIGLVIQLVWGMLQKIIGGPIGISFLGETGDVFRISSSSFEKGMSGTFGHPGPYALYSALVLPWLLFNIRIDKKIRTLGIASSTLMILLAAGRTSIALMIMVYLLYWLDKLVHINAKNIIITFSTIVLTILILIIFKEPLTPLIERFTNSDIITQLGNRKEHFEIAKYYIQQSPIAGSGLNNYLDLTYRDFPINFSANFYLNNPIHNVYLLYAIEIGIIGVVIFIAFILNNIAYLIKCNRNINIYKLSAIKGYVISLVVYCIYNFQGWGGVQNKTLIMMILASALIYNNYKNK